MQRIFPAGSPDADDGTGGLDVAETVATEGRDHSTGAPWVFANMVTTIDGAATLDGRSGGMGGPGDRLVFSALRAEADVIVVGAQTVRDERYRLPREPSPAAAAHRGRRGQGARPRLCIVTRSDHLDGGVPLLDELPGPDEDAAPWQRPILATPERPDGADRSGDDPRFDRIELGRDGVDLAGLLAELGRRGLQRVLCEGGPSLLGQLAEAGLVDEWDFTVAPMVVGGDSIRPLHSPTPMNVPLRLDRLFAETDGTLFARYLTHRATS